MKAWLGRFMYGRYGQDDLNRFLTVLSLIFLVTAIFTQWAILNSLTMVLLIFCIFRMFSRNTEKRGRENLAYLNAKGKVTGFFKRKKSRLSQTKTYRFYKCPSCKQQLRVPKGKGRINIRCPKCQMSFEKRT
jgi:predicted membrane protein